jgi:heterodisulfide reductase subunit A-like polyferredoxin
MPEGKNPSEEPRIGVYVCHCGGNISGVVQCELVAKALKQTSQRDHRSHG